MSQKVESLTLDEILKLCGFGEITAEELSADAARNNIFINSNYEELKQEYLGCWILVHEEQVVACNASCERLLKQMDKLGLRRTGAVTRYFPRKPRMLII